MSESGISNLVLKRYWGLILQRRYLALSVALTVLSIFTLAGFILPKVYESSSTIFIQRSPIINPLIQGVGVASNEDGGISTMQDIITSKEIIGRVIKRLDMHGADIDSIKRNILVTVKSGGGREAADLFKISYRGADPKNVRDVVNTLIEEYIAQTLGYRKSDVSWSL